MSIKFTHLDAEYIENILNLNYFADEEFPDLPLSCVFQPGADRRVLVVTGENASGKSFVSKLMAAGANRDKVEALTITMNFRTKGFMPSMILGGLEEDTSTGHLSLNGVIGGVRNCQNRECPHLMLWDEPDIGLSEAYQPAMGEYIGQFLAKLPDNTRGVIITTHSRILVKALVDACGFMPHHVRFNDNISLADWMANPPKPRTVEELLLLPKIGRKRWLAIDAIRAKKGKG